MIKMKPIPRTNTSRKVIEWSLVPGYSVFIGEAFYGLILWSILTSNSTYSGYEHIDITDIEYSLSKWGLFETVLMKSHEHIDCTIYTNYD